MQALLTHFFRHASQLCRGKIAPPPLKECPLAVDREQEVIEGGVPPDGRLERVRFRKEGLVRLRVGLKKAGVDARSFDFVAGRSPFPGLIALG